MFGLTIVQDRHSLYQLPLIAMYDDIHEDANTGMGKAHRPGSDESAEEDSAGDLESIRRSRQRLWRACAGWCHVSGGANLSDSS